MGGALVPLFRHRRVISPGEPKARSGIDPAIHDAVPRVLKDLMDHRVSHRQPRALVFREWRKRLARRAGRCGPVMTRVEFYPYRSRASAAPFESAASFANAISRFIGAMPQLVQGKMRSFGT